jgi:hypothetical protein
MRKALLVVLCLLLATAVFAQMQSGPSNKVGYVKIVTSGTPGGVGYTAFGLPFEFWGVVDGIPQYGVTSNKPADIIGDQSNGGSPTTGDKISQQGTGDIAVYVGQGPPLWLPPYYWSGGLQTDSTMVPGRAYYYQNKSGSNRDIVLAGEVNNSGGYGVAAIPAPVDSPGVAFYSYSWRDSRNVPREDLGLDDQGFTGGSPTSSDKLSEQGTGDYTVMTGGGPPFWLPPYNWSGGLEHITPGRAYYIQNRYHVPNDTWNYDYPGDGSAPASRQITDPTERTITKVTPAAPAKKSSARAGKVRE